jgi:hypothetical protein
MDLRGQSGDLEPFHVASAHFVRRGDFPRISLQYFGGAAVFDTRGGSILFLVLVVGAKPLRQRRSSACIANFSSGGFRARSDGARDLRTASCKAEDRPIQTNLANSGGAWHPFIGARRT